MKNPIRLWLLAAILAPATLLAQEPVTLSGRLVDADTGEPVYMATVTVPSLGVANLSNPEGVFSLRIKQFTDIDSIPASDSLLVSFLGYHEVRASVRDLAVYNREHGRPMDIRMYSNAMSLQAAVVAPEDPDRLFAMAFGRVAENYPEGTLGQSAFYRETVRRGNRCLVLNEAVLDINKSGYNKPGLTMDRVGIYKSRGSVAESPKDSVFLQIQGGPTALLNLDVVRYPFIGVYLSSVSRYYVLSYEGTAQIGDRLCHVIGFDQSPETGETLFRGRMYVTADRFAICRIEFSMNVDRDPDAYMNFVRKKPYDLKVKVNSADYLVTYREADGLWTMDYARAELTFETRRKNALLKRHYRITSELFVTASRPGEIRIPGDGKLRDTDFLTAKARDFSDPGFWEGYNILEPDAELQQIVQRIVRQLERAEQHRETLRK